MASDVDSDTRQQVAAAFVEARASGGALPAYPGLMPRTLDDGYAIQNVAIALRGGEVGGWKVGRINPPLGGVARLAGPIFAESIIDAGEQPPEMPIFSGGFGAAEAEFLLRVGAVPPRGKTEFTRDEAKALIGAVHVGIEIASSPFPGINENGAPVTISDFGNNNGLVVGPAIPDWSDEAFESWQVELLIDGVSTGTGKAVDMLDGAIGAARFLFGALAERGIELTPGQWISSGAVTGVHPVKVGNRIEARFDGRLPVLCEIVAS